MTMSGSLAAELEHQALVAGFSRAMYLPILTLPVKVTISGAGIRDHRVAHGARIGRWTTDSISGGRPASYRIVRQQQRRQRRQLRGLGNHSVVGGDRGGRILWLIILSGLV